MGINFKLYFNNAMEYSEYINLLGENLSLHTLHYNNFNPKNEEIKNIQSMPNINILVITEPWCGDSLALLPIFKRISEINSKWQLKIVLRDKNLDLIDKFLTRGGRAIPIFLILDNNYNFLFKWGPRPEASQNIFEQNRDKIENGEIEKSQIILKIRQYYSRDKGKETSKEIIQHLQINLK